MDDPYTQCYHPSGFIAEEAAVRGWSTDMLLDAMLQHYDEGRDKLELMLAKYFEVGPTTKSLRMEETLVELLHRTFGTPKAFWEQLERAWIEDPTQPCAL